MLRSDADSGNSSCSAGSQRRPTREASTNTDLRVLDHPRDRALDRHRLLSPARLFPTDRRQLTASHFDIHRAGEAQSVARRGGLSSAFSTIDLASSTRCELPGGPIQRTGVSRLRVRKQPVQRAASRLYRASVVQGRDNDVCVGPEFIVRSTHPSKHLDIAMNSAEKRVVVVILLSGQKIDVACDPVTTTAGEVFQAIVQLERFEHNFMLGVSALVGGDFAFLPDDYKIRKVAPEQWSDCGTLKRKTPKKITIDDGLAGFSLFLRIKFFMPPNLSKVVRGGVWRNWVYLQLRRSIVEGQITLQLPQLVELTGYALQAEFGNYSQREHASGDYYILEHYLPEGSICGNENHVRSLVKQAHQSCKHLTREEAKEKLIAVVQMFKDYGSHFYTAIWATRDGFARDVWLSISPRGMVLYSRNTCITALPRDTHISNISSRILLQSLAWQHIHTLHYNKRTLYVIPNDKAGTGSAVKNSKFKLKMDLNKSYFTFYLASLHHRFYMRLHADINSLLNISNEFSIPLSDNDKTITEDVNKNPWVEECSNFQDSYNIAVRGRFKLPKHKPLDTHMRAGQIEEIQNKENEKPHKGSDKNNELQQNAHDKSSDMANASSSEVLSSSESCSLPRRLGVKMGTRAFNGSNNSTPYHKQFHSLDATHLDKMNRLTISPERLVQSDIEVGSNHSDSDEPFNEQKKEHCSINKMSILPPRNYKSNVNDSSQMHQAYVIDSPQINNNTFIYHHPLNDDTIVDRSLQDKMNSLGCVQSDRFFKTVCIQRGKNGALGMQVAEGSDGNVYVKSITPGGPAAKLKQIQPGDQIISVNGQTLLNLNYNKALSMLQQASSNVEIILLQAVATAENQSMQRDHKPLIRHHSSPGSIVANLLNGNSLSKLSIHNNKSAILNDNSIPSTSYPNESQNLSKKLESQLDNDMLNVEALKTINVLLALTKRNIERKITPHNSNVNLKYKNSDISENMLDQIDTYQYSSSTESTPSKKHPKNKNHSFNMIRDSKAIKRRPLSVHIPSNVDLFETLDTTDDSLDNGFSYRTRSCDNITVLKANTSLNNANSFTHLKLVPTKSMELQVASQKNVPFSRKWAGHMKYPVTPSKIVSNVNKTSVNESSNQFLYRHSLSDDEQIFI